MSGRITAGLAAAVALTVACSSSDEPFDPPPPPLALEVVTSTLPDAVVGTPYAAALRSANARGDVEWSIVSGRLPDGLSLVLASSPAAQIVGTPQVEGDFSFAVEISDGADRTAEADLRIVVRAPPPPPPPLVIVTAPVLADGKAGEPYSARIEAAGGTPPYTWAIVDFSAPRGMTLAEEGTPATFFDGFPGPPGDDFAVAIEVRDADDATARKVFQWHVAPADPLALVTESVPNARVQVPYSAPLEVTGGVPRFSWSVRAGAFPDGLELLPSDGRLTTIEGTPTTAGRAVFEIRVGADGDETSRAFEMVVEPNPDTLRIATESLLATEVGLPYAQTIVAEGGTGSGLQWRITNGLLPDGLGLTGGAPNELVITGTPTELGAFEFRLRVEDDAGNVDTRLLEIVVVPPQPPLQILDVTNGSLALPAALGGERYLETITATGGVGQYTWRVEQGALPPGITLAGARPSATLTGLPRALGAFAATLVVRDAAGHEATADLTIVVDPPLTFPTIQTTALPAARICDDYRARIVGTGGSNAAYAWSVVSGALPPGFTLQPEGTPSALLSGSTTQVTGTYAFRVRLTDAFGDWDEVDLEVQITGETGGFRWVASAGVPEGSSRMYVTDVCAAAGPTIDVTVPNAIDFGLIDTDAYSAAFSPDGRYLAYIGDLTERDKKDVYVVQLAVPATGMPGTAMRVTDDQVLPPDSAATALKWSPDGRLLAFLDERRELYVVALSDPANPSAPTRVSAAYPAINDGVLEPFFVFAPDSRHIAFAARDPGSSAQHLYVTDVSPMLVDLPPGAPVRVRPGATDLGVSGSLTWTDDSSAIVFVGAPGVVWIDLSGPVPGPDVLLSPPLATGGTCIGRATVDLADGLALSPDGTKLAFSCRPTVDDVVAPYISDLTGPLPTVGVPAAPLPARLERGARFERWSPDSRKIAIVGFAHPISGGHEAYVADVSGPLPGTLHRLEHPRFSRDQGVIVTFFAMTFSGDGRWVSVIADLDLGGADSVFVADLTTPPPHALVRAHPLLTVDESIDAARFSFDGQSIRLNGRIRTSNAFQFEQQYVVHLDALGTWHLTHPPRQFQVQSVESWRGVHDRFWTADGSALIFRGRTGPGVEHTWRTHVSGPPPYTTEQLTRGDLRGGVDRIWAQGRYARRDQDFWRALPAAP